ncbi:MAG: DUF1007 family protein [Pseudomonadota bacterium]
MAGRNGHRLAALLAALIAAPGLAMAHPHQFITVTGALLLDQAGRLDALKVTYAMDETESLYIASEFGLDPDGPLTPAQARMVADAYVEGYEPFGWFAEIQEGGAPAPVARPRRSDARMDDGVLSIDFELPFAAPRRFTAPVEVYLYDPTYFAAIEWDAAPTILGAGAERCAVTLDRFVPDAAADRLLQALALIPPDETPDDPTVGRRFADKVEARCGDGVG